MEEFEESREVVQRLVDEYVGRRTPDSAALQLLPTDGGLTLNSSQPMEGTPPLLPTDGRPHSQLLPTANVLTASLSHACSSFPLSSPQKVQGMLAAGLHRLGLRRRRGPKSRRGAAGCSAGIAHSARGGQRRRRRVRRRCAYGPLVRNLKRSSSAKCFVSNKTSGHAVAARVAARRWRRAVAGAASRRSVACATLHHFARDSGAFEFGSPGR